MSGFMPSGMPAPAPCRICGSAAEVLFDFGSQPVAGFLESDEARARSAPRFPLALALCPQCTLLQQAYTAANEFLVERVYARYQPTYSASQDVGAYMQSFLDDAIARGELRPGDVVVEVGSNDGGSLEMLGSRGFRAIGFEPASTLAEGSRARGCDVRCEYFGSRAAENLREEIGPVKLVYTRHTLEHAFDPVDFLRALARIVAADGVVIIEVPYIGLQMVRNHFEAMSFQHVSYFSVSSMARAMEPAGLRIADVRFVSMDGGSMVISATATRSNEAEAVRSVLELEQQQRLHAASGYDAFFNTVAALRRDVPEFLGALTRRGQRVVGYGAGGKGQSMLNMLSVDREQLPLVIDDTPGSAGCFIPGTGIEVVARSDERCRDADVVFLTAPTHVAEIVRKESRRAGKAPRFLATTPGFQYVPLEQL